MVVSIDELIHEHGLPCPNYIKIDVPALTGAIIEGGARTLQRPQVRELHIEASEESTGGRRLVERLTQAGFTIAARHVHGGDDGSDFRQIWAGSDAVKTLAAPDDYCLVDDAPTWTDSVTACRVAQPPALRPRCK